MNTFLKNLLANMVINALKVGAVMGFTVWAMQFLGVHQTQGIFIKSPLVEPLLSFSFLAIIVTSGRIIPGWKEYFGSEPKRFEAGRLFIIMTARLWMPILVLGSMFALRPIDWTPSAGNLMLMALVGVVTYRVWTLVLTAWGLPPLSVCFRPTNNK